MSFMLLLCILLATEAMIFPSCLSVCACMHMSIHVCDMHVYMFAQTEAFCVCSRLPVVVGNCMKCGCIAM